MLAPPNGGSEVVNGLRRVPFVSRIMGPAFLQLSIGTDAEASWVSGLPSPEFELGVKAGRANNINSIARDDENKAYGVAVGYLTFIAIYFIINSETKFL